MLGNLLLFPVVLFLIGLLYYTASPAPSGDYGVGYSLMLVIFGGGFVLFSALLTWNLSLNNGFDWIQTPGTQRSLLVFVGWVAFMIATFLSASLRTAGPETGVPPFLYWLSQAYAAYWLPMLMLVPVVLLLNLEREAGVAPDFIKIPIKTGFLLSVLMGLGVFFASLRANT